MDWPIPKDVPLDFPAPGLLLEILAVVSFLGHILFVALMVGGSILTAVFEWKGFRDRDYERLAHIVGRTITVNKSLAVVLGVAPLLVVNTLYTVYFYSANALTGTAWIMIVPLVTVAFLLSYAHEYSWDLLAEQRGLHFSLGVAAAVLFTLIPLIFLSNINLMLFPEHWGHVRGFLSTLVVPNVLPRYLHFLTATVALTGLFLVWYTDRPAFPRDEFSSFSTRELKRLFYTIAFGATTLQLLFGPLVYLTLPPRAVTWRITFMILLGLVAAVVAIWLLWSELRAGEGVGQRFWPIVSVLGVTVLLMGTARHMVRETAIGPHREQMVAKTAAYMQRVLAAQNYAVVPGGLGTAAVPSGAAMFRKSCASCHAWDRRLVGPPVNEIATIYAGNPSGIVAWAKAPGKKRSDYPRMPAQNLPDDELAAIAEYMLRSGPQ